MRPAPTLLAGGICVALAHAGDASLIPVRAAQVGQYVNDLVGSDVDGDGRQDLVVLIGGSLDPWAVQVVRFRSATIPKRERSPPSRIVPQPDRVGMASTDSRELTMVQLSPRDTSMQSVSSAAYPGGTISVAVQVVPGSAPSISNTAGADSEASWGVPSTVPEVQVRLTETEAASSGWKSLLTAIALPLSVFVITQLPPSGTAAQSDSSAV